MQKKSEPKLPDSASGNTIAAAGFLSFVGTLAFIWVERPFSGNIVHCALLLIFVCATSIIITDSLIFNAHKRISTGIDYATKNPSWQRTLTKYIGLIASILFIGSLYWIFPEYHGSFYTRYYSLLLIIVPLWLPLALPYFYFVDRHMPNPYDGYWQIGQLILGKSQTTQPEIIKQHLLGWIIKGYFFPLMFTYLCNDLSRFINFNPNSLTDFQHWYDILFDFFFFIDVTIVSMGYLVSLRIVDTHLRSAEPTLLGWVSALICYEPFWSLIGRNYLSYDTGYPWGRWLSNLPWVYDLWGCVILVLTAIYVWATLSFGARFSNLTHRGIITSGPYRWTKHPAYLAKNLSWWLISIPFMAQTGWDEALRHSLLLLALNGVYWLRAKTEERHLSFDPTYVAYCQWMEQHGLFRALPKLHACNLTKYT